MQHNRLAMANLLINQERLYIGTLVATKLNDFSRLFILLYGTVTTKILFESLADSFDVQVVGQARDRRDTLAAIALLDAHVYFFGRIRRGAVTGILKGVYKNNNGNEKYKL